MSQQVIYSPPLYTTIANAPALTSPWSIADLSKLRVQNRTSHAVWLAWIQQSSPPVPLSQLASLGAQTATTGGWTELIGPHQDVLLTPPTPGPNYITFAWDIDAETMPPYATLGENVGYQFLCATSYDSTETPPIIGGATQFGYVNPVSYVMNHGMSPLASLTRQVDASGVSVSVLATQLVDSTLTNIANVDANHRLLVLVHPDGTATPVTLPAGQAVEILDGAGVNKLAVDGTGKTGINNFPATQAVTQNGTWNVGVINGNNQIAIDSSGKIGINALPALVAGSASIGTVGLNAGSNAIGSITNTGFNVTGGSQPIEYPAGATILTGNDNGASNTTRSATLTGAAAVTVYLRWLMFVASGVTTPAVFSFTITGLLGGTITSYMEPTVVGTGGLTIWKFDPGFPWPASGANTNVVFSSNTGPAGGFSSVHALGFRQ